MMDAARTVGMFNAWIRQANARVRREILWAEAEERRALATEAAKEGKTVEQKIAADLQKKRERLDEEMAELTMEIEQTSLRYSKNKHSMRQQIERLQGQMGKIEDQINEHSSSIQTLLYAEPRAKKAEDAQDEEALDQRKEKPGGIRGRRWEDGIKITAMADQG